MQNNIFGLVPTRKVSLITCPTFLILNVGNNIKKIGFDSYLVYISTKLYFMARQSISFTKPNDEWLKSQVDKQEYSSKSELVNDLIRQARSQQVQIDWIRAKLEKAENSGFTNDTKSEILKQSKAMLNG